MSPTSIGCQIQWIDEQGNPTPDKREAVGVVYEIAHTWTMRDGTVLTTEQSPCYPICAEHLKRLDKKGMEFWRFIPYPKEG